jgi:ribonucleoside-diphosphate reductase alpha chain
MSEKLLKYFNGDELAANVFESKYKQGDESPDDMHYRMAKEFARIEYNYIVEERNTLNIEQINALSSYGEDNLLLNEEELPKEKLLKYLENEIYNLFKDFKYIVPQGSIMSNLGSKAITSLSNCFVIGQPNDSYGGIFKKDEEMVQLMKRRGGVGIDISTLRPAGTLVSNAAKTSTGAISFMHRFSNSTREVAQGGRRGE